jgi:FtsP/CotA-like multicopper oxidase with cupredoxin domain
MRQELACALSVRPTTSRRIALTAGLGVLAVLGVAAAQAGWPSYDIGAPGTPKPTGKVKEFRLVAREAEITIAPGVKVRAQTYNGTVPGPTIRVTEGDTVRVTLKNELKEETSIHWHGLHVPNGQDGVPPFTQKPIKPGETFTYQFVASHAGTFMYHSHQNAVDQVDAGLYAPLIIDPQTPPKTKFNKEFTMLLSAWNVEPAAMPDMPGMPADPDASGSDPSTSMAGMNYNYFTINGKAFPSNPTWNIKKGELVRVRLINISNLAHPMHLHGMDFTVIAKDGEPVRPNTQQTMNTINVAPGETYDIAIRAEAAGTWIFHCHELHHTENDGVEPGGLIQTLTITDSKTVTAPAPPTQQIPAEMPGMKH